jgi:hypothetical protein
MPDLERDANPRFGAYFFKSGDDLMFQFQADSSSKIGPRKATDTDKRDHAGAYEDYLSEAFRGAPLEAFDHDDNGHPGGAVSEPVVSPAKRRGRPPKDKD